MQIRRTCRFAVDRNAVVVVKADQLVEAQCPGQGARFSLLFQGPHDRLLPQGTYQFDHDQIGSFPLFIVPVGAAKSGLQYEAVFNRLE